MDNEDITVRIMKEPMSDDGRFYKILEALDYKDSTISALREEIKQFDKACELLKVAHQAEIAELKAENERLNHDLTVSDSEVSHLKDQMKFSDAAHKEAIRIGIEALEKIANDKEFSHTISKESSDGYRFVRNVWYVEHAKRELARLKQVVEE